MKKLPLKSPMLALALLPLLLAACGGSDDKDSGSNSNNPADPQAGATQKSKHPPIPDTGVAPPNDEEKAAFNASKISIEPYNALNGAKPAPFLITAEDGTPTRGFDGENAQRDFSKLPSGFTSVKGTLTLVKNDNNGGTNPTPTPPKKDDKDNQAVTLRSYQGFRSGVYIAHSDQPGVFVRTADYGVWSKAEQLPSSGRATYHGVAFDRADQGTLTYHVDFAARTGEGQIDGLPRYDGTINLRRAGFQTRDDGSIGIRDGAADSRYKGSLTYSTGFAGAGAEELTGYVVNAADAEIVGFHGTRGEISQ
mgnify:CR=1 FL=1